MRRASVIVLLAAALSGLCFAPAQAAEREYPSTAAFVQTEILDPHHSVIEAVDMVACWRIYDIPVLDMLVILGAETSIGDPSLGGQLVGVNNFGCVRAFSGWETTPWGAWANGTITIRSRQWLTWPSPEVGLYAWCRYIRRGVGGAYPAILERGDWAAFARIYYGADVPGLETYTADLYAIQARMRALAGAHGYVW